MDATTWTSFDGKELPYATAATAASDADQVVILVHGLSGASSDFQPLVGGLASEPVAFHAVELRGQGRDPAIDERGDIRSPEIWWRDLLAFDALVRERHPGLPVIWHGESLGALIVLHAHALAKREQRPLPDGLILQCPVVASESPLSGWREFLVRALIRLFPTRRVSLGELAPKEQRDQPRPMTHDRAYQEEIKKQPHYLERFSLRLLGGIGKMMATSGEAARAVEVPVLVLHSPNDVFVSGEQTERFFDRIPSRAKTLRRYEDSYHLLLHDRQAEEVVADVRKWLENL